MHGLTSTLSEAGLSAIPPLQFDEWRSGNGYEVGVRLHLPQGRDSLIGAFRRVRINPNLAAYKYLARLDSVDVSASAPSSVGVVVDT